MTRSFFFLNALTHVQNDLPHISYNSAHSIHSSSKVMLANCDLNEMEEPEEPVGPLDGKFEYKKNDGTIDKHVVIFTDSRKEFTFDRSTSGLKYHLNAKHVFVSSLTWGATPGLQQTTLAECRALSKSTSDKMTDTIENGSVDRLTFWRTQASEKFWMLHFSKCCASHRQEIQYWLKSTNSMGRVSFTFRIC